MQSIREAIDIAAPVQDVWAAVHRDIPRVPAWSPSVVRAEVVGGGPLERGSELRYVVGLPIGRTATLRLLVERCEEFHECSGTFSATAMSGTWAWRYRKRGSGTTVTYQSDVKVGAMLRLVARTVEGQLADDARRNLEALKGYVEGGKRQT